jgi:gentisate 1,2-dioxygenase
MIAPAADDGKGFAITKTLMADIQAVRPGTALHV